MQKLQRLGQNRSSPLVRNPGHMSGVRRTLRNCTLP